MSVDTHRLVYRSRLIPAESPAAMRAMIEAILAASRRNNARVGVTGALMFSAGGFAQVLEGPRAAVEHVFERIQQDPRHDDVAVLSFGPVGGRAFDQWSMAYVGMVEVHADRYASLAAATGYDPSRMTGDAVFGMLEQLVREEESAAPGP